MKTVVLTLASVLVCLTAASPAAAQPNGGPGSAEDVMNSYIQNSFAKNLNGTLSLFQNSPATYFHINGIYYFTTDPVQGTFQIVSAKNYVDGWSSIYQGFSAYFSTLVQALSVKTITRTNGQGMSAPLDGADKLDGETNYVILAKFVLDNQGDTGWAIVHGLDQFRINHNQINNINNLEKTVFLSPQESIYLDSLASDALKISWALNRTCALKTSVFASIDFEKRWDIGLQCM